MSAQLIHANFGAGLEPATATVPDPAVPSSTEFDSALAQVLSLCSPGSTISTRVAIEGLRRRLPHLRIEDEDLVNIVADLAIARGLSVTFDSRD